MAASKPDPLSAYRAKRSAERTPEPFGRAPAANAGRFVVQQHAARRLHYDFRLELDGVLVSWAVPKGPSPNPADKRLAVRVEDHPLEYADFEGHIPAGNYGAGAVIVWDRGAWAPIGDPAQGLETGKLLFDLKGYKLRGRWTLVKTRRGDKDWLLIKEKDGEAAEVGTESYAADSILSGKTVEALKQKHDRATDILQELERLRAPRGRVVAGKVKVMLAAPGEAFSDADWLFEIKLDGYRLVVERSGDTTRLYSRAGLDLTATFPEIAEVVSALPFEHVVMDGEAVVHDAQGRPSFARLQKRGRLMRQRDIARAAIDLPASFYIFDLLGFGDYDPRALALTTRKALLKEVLPSTGPVRYAEHIEHYGEALYAQMREMGLEGVVAKKADSPYRAGRSRDWIKVSLGKSGDFVIVGYTDPKGSQPELGALLLGEYAGDELVYAGRAGTGLSRQDQHALGARLKQAHTAPPPTGAPQAKDAHWVAPELVCEVRYKQITGAGVLRQPVFVRLRDDKRVEECVRASDEPAEPEAATPRERVVNFTNLDKPFWPEDGYTKGGLIEYYRAVSPWLLPYLKDRPLVLTRYPDGIHGKSFFQKDAPDFAPEWIRTERLWSEHAEREVRYFVADDLESLLYVVNLGALVLHVWSSRMAALERPDWCILDLDPKEAPFKHVIEIAKALRRLCRAIELPCFVKTSGSTGLHVLIPLGQQFTYEQSRTLGELLARVTVSELPDVATVSRALSERGGRVYIDYLQNGHGRLLVAPFSARPLPGAPVSMPLKWGEVNAKLDNGGFTLANAARRMRSLKADPLRALLTIKPDLGAALQKLSERFG